MLVAPVLLTVFRVLAASSTGVSTSATVLVAQVLTTMVLVAGSTGATFIKAPMLLTVFRVLCPKISTGLEKLAPTGWHGWHVFATLLNLTKVDLI